MQSRIVGSHFRRYRFRCSPTHLATISNSNFSTSTAEAKTVLLVGCSGSLGSTLASHLKESYQTTIIGVDFTEPSSSSSCPIDAFIELSPDHASIPELTQGMQQGLNETLESPQQSINAMIVTSGGFAMDPSVDIRTAPEDVVQSVQVHDDLMKMNYNPLVATGSLLPHYMTHTNGLFVGIGATASLYPQPTLQAYGSSKAAAAYYLSSLGHLTHKSLKNKYVQRDQSPEAKQRRARMPHLQSLTVLGILPETLDTNVNRSSLNDMTERQKQEAKTWTPPMDIARQIGIWLDIPSLRPHSGSLVKTVTSPVEVEGRGVGRTEFKLVR